MAKLLTLHGQIINSTAYIYIICAVEFEAGPRFGGFCVKTGPRVVFKTGPSSCFTVVPHIYSVLGACLKTQIVSICAKIVFSQNCRDIKNEVFEKKIAFFMLLQEKQKK